MVTELQHIFAPIHALATKLERFRAKRFDHTVMKLEAIYKRVNEGQKTSLRDSFSATTQVVIAHVLIYEFYFLVIGISLLLISTGALTPHDVELGLLRLLFIGLVAVLSVLVPMLLVFITLPFHYLYGMRLGYSTAVQALLAAVIVSLLEPPLAAAVLPVEPLGFWELILPNLVIFSLGLGFLTLRLHALISYHAYEKRHADGGLECVLPLHLKGKLVSVSARDHYVEIVTVKGVHLHRMAFSEAVQMVAGVKGMMVHRSHWVSCNAMLSLGKSAGRFFITLRDGGQLPVAKSKAKQVQNFLDTR